MSINKIAEKQKLEKALVKAAKVVDNIAIQIKQQQKKAATVSKQLIFLVNKKLRGLLSKPIFSFAPEKAVSKPVAKYLCTLMTLLY